MKHKVINPLIKYHRKEIILVNTGIQILVNMYIDTAAEMNFSVVLGYSVNVYVIVLPGISFCDFLVTQCSTVNCNVIDMAKALQRGSRLSIHSDADFIVIFSDSRDI